jgi:hypothetical protein
MYCWDVFKKSECETCTYFQKFQQGTLDLKKAHDVIFVDSQGDSAIDESIDEPAPAPEFIPPPAAVASTHAIATGA